MMTGHDNELSKRRGCKYFRMKTCSELHRVGTAERGNRVVGNRIFEISVVHAVKLLVQWFQWIESGHFSYYDFGKMGNLIK